MVISVQSRRKIMASLSIKNLYKIYSYNFQAVKDFNLEVEDKEFVVVMGPVECGKSVLLRLIAGLETVTKGEIYINDHMVNEVEAKDRELAMLFRNCRLYPEMSVYENLAFGLQMKKYTRNQIEAIVLKVVDQLEISDLLQKKPKELTAVQTQRVAMGRALVKEPKVLLMDDFIIEADSKDKLDLQLDIIQLQAKLGLTIIYATEDIGDALKLGNRIVIMREGSILQVDTPKGLYLHPKNMAVAGSIMKPRMNFIEVKLEQRAEELFVVFLGREHMLNKNKAENLIESGYVGKNIIAGIYADEVVGVAIDETNNSSRFIGEVKELKSYGDNHYAYFDFAGNAFAAILKDGNTIGPEDKIYFTFEETGIYLFDKENGNVIYSSTNKM